MAALSESFTPHSIPGALTVQIGSYSLPGTLVVAPMAGVTDRPFRTLCRSYGAALAVSEMIGSQPGLVGTLKTQRRMDHKGEVAPVSVQIVGADPAMLADAARFNAAQGADIIDINMGCPAKKVCSVAAGSALLRDEVLVGRILDAVVAAVDVPVTLKIRTGWDASERNAVRIARIAERAGIRALAVHGRTRADAFRGEAEYRTIAEVKRSVAIPVIANGDIDSPQKAQSVLKSTAADALMIGRAAQGRPWIFRDIEHFLRTGVLAASPTLREIERVMRWHLHELHALYGEVLGPRIARKHIGWYMADLPGGVEFRNQFNRIESPVMQFHCLATYFRRLEDGGFEPAANAREELAA